MHIGEEDKVRTDRSDEKCERKEDTKKETVDAANSSSGRKIRILLAAGNFLRVFCRFDVSSEGTIPEEIQIYKC